MTTKIISHTIIASGYTLSSAYSVLSITSTGTIDGAVGAPGQSVPPGGVSGGRGGVGLTSAHGAAAYNAGVIAGGLGGGLYGDVGGAGGAGVSLTGGVLTNTYVITGGQGGAGASPTLEAGSAYQGSGGSGGMGVFMSGGSLVNLATITGGEAGAGGLGAAGPAGGIGVYMEGNASLTNSGAISGGQTHAFFAGGGVELTGAGAVDNSGVITGAVGHAHGGFGLRAYSSSHASVTITNSGLIIGGAGASDEAPGGSGGYGLWQKSAALIIDGTGGTISGGAGGAGSAGGVSGAGKDGGRGGVGVYVDRNATMTTIGGAVIGGAGGAGGKGGSGNGGAGGAGVYVSGFGYEGVTSRLLVNQGDIRGGSGGTPSGGGGAGVGGDGIHVAAGLVGETIVNEAGGLITGRYGFWDAPGAGGGNTVTNFGAIVGTSGVSIRFRLATSRLIAEAGAVFTGAVDGGDGTLELASGVGTLSGLGAGGRGTVSAAMALTFVGFRTFVLDAGSAWTFEGANTLEQPQKWTLAAGAALTVAPGQLVVAGTVNQNGLVTLGAAGPGETTLQILKTGVWEFGAADIAKGTAGGDKIVDFGLLIKNAGTGTSTVSLNVTDDGLIEAATGDLDIAGKLFGTGALKIDAGATLEAGGSAAKTLTVDFNGAGATLAMRFTQNVAATIDGFAATDIPDLLKTRATGASVNTRDQLVVVNGSATVATLQLAGSYGGATFSVGSDGQGGTDITLGSDAARAQRPTSAPTTAHAFVAAMAGLGAAAMTGSAAMAHLDAPRPMLLAPRTSAA